MTGKRPTKKSEPEEAKYRLRITKTVKRGVDELPGNVRQRVRRMISSLAADPRPTEAEELRQDVLPEHYKIPLGKWRIIFRVNDEDRVVDILAVREKTGPETYQNLE